MGRNEGNVNIARWILGALFVMWLERVLVHCVMSLAGFTAAVCVHVYVCVCVMAVECRSLAETQFLPKFYKG